jgi:hypothetical protein
MYVGSDLVHSSTILMSQCLMNIQIMMYEYQVMRKKIMIIWVNTLKNRYFLFILFLLTYRFLHKFLAPEYVLDENLDFANDMFALGCLVYTVHSHGKPPMENHNSSHTYRKNIDNLSSISYNHLPYHLHGNFEERTSILFLLLSDI